jgi:site-specific recombinase XerD
VKVLPAKQPPLLSDVVDGFLYHLRDVRGLSPHTVVHYGHDLSLFLRYSARQLDIDLLELRLDDVTSDHIQDFLQYLTEARGNSARSVKRRLAALRTFFSYVIEKHCSSSVQNGYHNPALAVSLPAVQEPPPPTLTVEEARQLLRAARVHAPNPVRDYAIMRLFLQCGARLSEVLLLDFEHINLSKGFVQLGAGTDRERFVPLSEDTYEALTAYLTMRPNVPSNRVFISRRRTPITKGTVYHVFRRCLSAAALSGVTIYTLRHTCFTLLAQEGFTASELKELAGFRRLQTAQAYLRLAFDKRLSSA